MKWSKSLEGAAVAGGAAVAAALPALLGGGLTKQELATLAITFLTVFFAYLKTHLPDDIAPPSA